LKELAILGKITSGVREWGPPLHFQNIVVDAYATGHFLSLLRAPRGMGELIESGPMGDQSRKIFSVLLDKQVVTYHLVTLPEELPVTEVLELSADLQALVGDPGQLYLNKFYVQPQGPRGSRPQAFDAFMADLAGRQTDAERALQASNRPFMRLPYVLQADPARVVSELAATL
jgi:hypothetical protein